MYFEFQVQPSQGATWSPTVDVSERPKEIVVFVEMPGVDRADIQLTWHEGLLILTGLKRQQPANLKDGAKYLCVERLYGPFRREISIKVPIDYKHAKAELKEGLLRIHLPKRMEPETVVIPIV